MTLVALSCALVAANPNPNPGMDRAVRDAMKLFANDPPIENVQRAALEYFRVSADDLSGYDWSARLRWLIPSLTGTYTQDDRKENRLWTDRADIGEPWDPNNPQTTDTFDGTGRIFSADATWDLRGLVFDNSQIEAYSLVGIHEDVVKEVTRLYYTRQHNILALALDPPKDVRARAALILRTREIEAMLDALTGGEWSRMRQAQH